MSERRPSNEGGALTETAGPRAAPPKHEWRPGDLAHPVPEALRSPAIVGVAHSQVLGDPYNIRESLPSVQRLAWSIYQHGLLENLLVVELSPDRARATGKSYELRAGSRRFEAIRRLIEEGVEPPPGHPDRDHGIRWTWPADKVIPVLVLGSEGHYEHLIENIERSEPHPWEIGRRLNEALSAGVSSRELGTRLGRSNGWVTRYAHIGEGLSPEVIELIRKERAEVKVSELAQLATIRDPFGDPDGPAQVEAFKNRRARRRKRPRRIDPHSFRATLKRLQYLRSDMPVPAMLRPIVSAVIDYLEGGERPHFRQIETALFEKLRAHSHYVDTDLEPEPASS